jgi:acyl phosphate:glycerol-3-phosphate acyltransferase
MPSMTTIALFFLAAYLIGSIPFGLLLTRWRKGIDIRAHGSGNIGATNVRRIAGNALGGLTLAGDMAKGFLPVAAVPWLLPAGHPGTAATVAATALAAFCGHLFPIGLGFRGGKGVATAMGACLAISPLAILGVLAAFGLGLGLSRRVSMGSLAAAAALPLSIALKTHAPALTIGALLIAVGIFARHRENIERVLAGKEPRLF